MLRIRRVRNCRFIISIIIINVNVIVIIIKQVLQMAVIESGIAISFREHANTFIRGITLYASHKSC